MTIKNPDLIGFLLKYEKTRKYLSKSIGENLLRATNLSRNLFENVILIPAISDQALQDFLLKAPILSSNLSKSDSMYLLLNKRPSIFTDKFFAILGNDAMKHLYIKSFILDFFNHPNLMELPISPPLFKGIFDTIQRFASSKPNQPLFFLKFPLTLTENEVVDCKKAIQLWRFKKIENEKGIRLLALGAVEFEDRRALPRNALGRCAQNRLFEPRLFGLIKSFLFNPKWPYLTTASPSSSSES